MTFARITHSTAAGSVEIVTDQGIQIWTPGDSYEVVGEQGTLWAGTWPRLRPPCLCDGEHVCGGENVTSRGLVRPRLHVVDGGYVSDLHEGTGPFRPPSLRLIPGGKE